MNVAKFESWTLYETKIMCDPARPSLWIEGRNLETGRVSYFNNENGASRASHTILFTQVVPIVIFRAIGNLTFCHFHGARAEEVGEMSAQGMNWTRVVGPPLRHLSSSDLMQNLSNSTVSFHWTKWLPLIFKIQRETHRGSKSATRRNCDFAAPTITDLIKQSDDPHGSNSRIGIRRQRLKMFAVFPFSIWLWSC